jgi:hypothetical protein
MKTMVEDVNDDDEDDDSGIRNASARFQEVRWECGRRGIKMNMRGEGISFRGQGRGGVVAEEIHPVLAVWKS